MGKDPDSRKLIVLARMIGAKPHQLRLERHRLTRGKGVWLDWIYVRGKRPILNAITVPAIPPIVF